MSLPAPDVCYRALTSRDARFDGRFFVGVRTTGVYCRPVCPARTPRRENVRFYPCAAAAEQAGFRACRRCRPETAPGTPAWVGSSATVARALRLIATGALDGARVDTLADRLGVGERQLRRLFRAHLGVTPIAVAQSRRAHFARTLLDQTDLPMARVAEAAGFGSVRRFNDAVRRAFGAPPTELRNGRRSTGAGLAVRLPYRPPFDWDGLLRFLAARAIPGVETVEDDRYRRTARVGRALGTLEVSHEPARAAVIVRVEETLAAELLEVVERVRRLLDLGADPAVIGPHLARDPLLAPAVARRPGLRVPGAFDPFEGVVRAILGQQVSVAAARTLAARLVRLCGELAGDCWLFPSAAAVAAAPLVELGITRARAACLAGVAAAVRDGALSLDAGADRVRAALLALPGIGEWTAEYVAMRVLGEPDAFPASDLGVRKALGRPGEPVSAAEAAVRVEGLRPFRAYALLHLWTTDLEADDDHGTDRARDAGRNDRRARRGKGAPRPRVRRDGARAAGAARA